MEINKVISNLAVEELVDFPTNFKDRIERVLTNKDAHLVEQGLADTLEVMIRAIEEAGYKFERNSELRQEDILVDAGLTDEMMSDPDLILNEHEKISSAAAILCKSFCVPYSIGYDSIRLWIHHYLKGNKNSFQFFTKQTFLLLTITSSDKMAPSLLGSSGGRKPHPHKELSLNLAKEIWDIIPEAKIGDVIKSVRNKIQKKYKEVPSEAALKSWLKDVDFRPQNSDS